MPRRASRFSESVSLTVYPLKMIRAFGKRWLSAASFGHGAARKIMPSGTACDSDNDDNANLFSSGTMTAKPIGVNAAMTSPQAAAAANQAANVDPSSTVQKVANTLTKISALVGATISQNTFEMW